LKRKRACVGWKDIGQDVTWRVRSTRVLGTVEIEVREQTPKNASDRKRNQPRSARTATMTIQAARVTLRGPQRPGGRPPDVEINAVFVREKEHYLPCVALYMVIAWRVMYVMMLGRQCPEMSCTELFGEAEWKAVYTVVRSQAAPEQPPTLAAMISVIASLGGHLGRKHDDPPGPKTMWIGMQRMRDPALAWDAFQLTARRARSRKNAYKDKPGRRDLPPGNLVASRGTPSRRSSSVPRPGRGPLVPKRCCPGEYVDHRRTA
jgi:hypothetical protein